MKRIVIVAVVAGFAATMALGQTIVGSDHDFSSETWNTEGEVCIPCHAPHNVTEDIVKPLWNHEVTVATFTMYGETTRGGNTAATPGDSSKLCLSCHDGTVAVDNYGGRTGGGTFVSGSALVGTDLSNDHPISIAYPEGAAGYFPDASALSLPFFGAGNLDVECGSCHDPHNSSGAANFLRVANTASALCLTCHDK